MWKGKHKILESQKPTFARITCRSQPSRQKYDLHSVRLWVPLWWSKSIEANNWNKESLRRQSKWSSLPNQLQHSWTRISIQTSWQRSHHQYRYQCRILRDWRWRSIAQNLANELFWIHIVSCQWWCCYEHCLKWRCLKSCMRHLHWYIEHFGPSN